MDKKMELMAEYGINVDTLDFSIEDFTIEELTEKFEAMTKAAAESTPEPENIDAQTSDFALNSNIVESIRMSLALEKVSREWGDAPRYCYVDCDMDLCEVYCWDSEDWLLYGFSYSMNGDNVVIDFESKKRMKYVVAEFDEGEQPSPFAASFEAMSGKIQEFTEIEEKFNAASETISSLEKEVAELRSFKSDVENKDAMQKREEVFSRFEDLIGIEGFDALKEHCMDYSLEDLEDKCFALRGRNMSEIKKFSLEDGTPKLKVVQNDSLKEKENAPYGGIVERYADKG